MRPPTSRKWENQWVDFTSRDEGAEPASNVRALLQTCPANAPVGDPYVADDWASISPAKSGWSHRNPRPFPPVAAIPRPPGSSIPPRPAGPARPRPAARETGTASYELDRPRPAASPCSALRPWSRRSSRKASTRRSRPGWLTSRPTGRPSCWSPAALAPQGEGFQVFQLHANAWKVEEGHVLRLELLPKDASVPAGLVANYGRPSNGQTDATVTDLDLRIPGRRPARRGRGLVTAPAARSRPTGPA